MCCCLRALTAELGTQLVGCLGVLGYLAQVSVTHQHVSTQLAPRPRAATRPCIRHSDRVPHLRVAPCQVIMPARVSSRPTPARSYLSARFGPQVSFLLRVVGHISAVLDQPRGQLSTVTHPDVDGPAPGCTQDHVIFRHAVVCGPVVQGRIYLRPIVALALDLDLSSVHLCFPQCPFLRVQRCCRPLLLVNQARQIAPDLPTTPPALSNRRSSESSSCLLIDASPNAPSDGCRTSPTYDPRAPR
jgi:hypothetical protein